MGQFASSGGSDTSITPTNTLFCVSSAGMRNASLQSVRTEQETKIESEPILIVIADDDPAMRKMLAGSLRKRGYVVDECDDGQALLTRLKSCAQGAAVPSLVISDVRMPGASGLDVLHWQHKWLPEVPVILITAFGDRRTHQRAQELGAAKVINKPFALSHLQSEVARLLDSTEANEKTDANSTA